MEQLVKSHQSFDQQDNRMVWFGVMMFNIGLEVQS
jgi:hypothetical protein